MPTVIYVNSNGSRTSITVETGMSVMAGAVEHGVDGIVGQCGGNAICGTCHVYVNPGQLSLLEPISDDEDATLEIVAAERRPNSRLGCQITMKPELDGLIVEMPEFQL
ncbi:MAG: 2Fe-2S iron-sulfur cluster binding domain-containing protein [Rhodospirillales bacterium]|nr:2Fe-2S iron-sulfur cluster binding domain-containing protein [Rhodospirillales bacterium]MDE2318681.1 2Fe-2S iron-sulfur cluster binding domain-containing protein [Rhodospirillales bacterium]